jgi:hypothetical protein
MLTSELLLLFNNAGQHIGNMVFHWHYRRLLEPMIELFPKTLSLVQFTDYDEAMDSTVGGTLSHGEIGSLSPVAEPKTHSLHHTTLLAGKIAVFGQKKHRSFDPKLLGYGI